jgi:biopolymer transport protein ExbD
MAQIENEKKASNKQGVKKLQKQSTRVDLTPMVDLGFLLLTFFVFTTTMQQPTAMQLNVPKDDTIKTPVCNSCALTVIPAKNNLVYYYEGAADNNPQIKTTSFSSAGLRQIILAKKAAVQAMGDEKKELVLIIKPADASLYKNFVNIMDEVTINDVKHYFVAGADANDKKLLANFWQ